MREGKERNDINRFPASSPIPRIISSKISSPFQSFLARSPPLSPLRDLPLQGERLQLKDAFGIEPSPFKQESNVITQSLLQPGGMPDIFVAQHQNRITSRTPTECPQQNGVEQADVVGREKDRAKNLLQYRHAR